MQREFAVMDEAEARIAIAEHLGVPVALVVDEAQFRELGADSLDLIELSVALEQQFDIRLADDEVEGCTTIGEAIAILARAPPLRGRPAEVGVEEYGESRLEDPPLVSSGSA